MKLYQAGMLLVAVCFLLMVGGCASDAPKGGSEEVTVFAAASLQDAFGELAKGMQVVPTYNFAGSQSLAAQLSQGARADVYASADDKNMQSAIEAGSVVSDTQQVFATNRLVVVTAPGSHISSLSDLAKPGVKLVLAGPSVPAGNYSLQALGKLAASGEYGGDFADRVQANVVSRENNVRQALAKVELGEADGGIVYGTDAKSSGKPIGTIEIPDKYNVAARYYIAPVKGASHPEAADKFIRYVLSEAGQKILSRYGFGPAK